MHRTNAKLSASQLLAVCTIVTPDAKHRSRFVLLASCAFCLAGLALPESAALAGCNSGNVSDTSLLHGSGCQATAVGSFSTAVGWAASAAESGTAVGRRADASSNHATALGHEARAAEGATGLGRHARGSGIWSTAIGGSPSNGPNALGSYSIAIGGGNDVVSNPAASAENPYGIAIGTGALARGDRSVAVGAFAGDDAVSGSGFNSAFGSSAGRSVDGTGNTALGQQSGSAVDGHSNSAFGAAAGVTVTGNGNTAGGVLAGWIVEGRNNSAYGANSGVSVTGDANVAVGPGAGAFVNGNNNVAIGSSAGRNVTASNSVSVGIQASATRNGALALGSNASVTKVGAVALGQGSVADIPYTVSVGSVGNERRIVNVAAGVNLTDAVNLGQVQAMLSAQASGAKPAGAVSHAQFEALLPAANASAAAQRFSAGPTSRIIDDIRRELADLRATVQRQQDEIARQQQEIAELKHRKAMAVRAARE